MSILCTLLLYVKKVNFYGIFNVNFSLVSVSAKEKDSNYGSFIGTLSNKEQGISGQLYSIDKNTVYLRNFTFTGTGSGEYL